MLVYMESRSRELVSRQIVFPSLTENDRIIEAVAMKVVECLSNENSTYILLNNKLYFKIIEMTPLLAKAQDKMLIVIFSG